MSASSRIYADYNATAPLREEARAAVSEAMEEVGNPSSVHAEGRRAKAVLERARDQVAMAIGACRDDLVFTSGGTEANAAVLKGAVAADPSLHLIVSAVEHDAVRAQCPGAEIAPVDNNGVVQLDWLRERLSNWSASEGRPFLSLMLANNETGAIQPVAQAARMMHEAGGLIHTDAVQALGKIKVSVVDLEVDYLTLSAHKIGGPKGAGAFFLATGAPYAAQQLGGGQESGRRAGTENIAGAAGFGAACEAALTELDEIVGLGALRDVMEARLKSEAGVAIFAEDVERLANTTCVGLAGFSSETQVMAMDLAGVAVSSGAACSSGKVKRSHVLDAMGVSEDLAMGALRISFGWRTTPEDYEKTTKAWLDAALRAGAMGEKTRERA